MFEFLKEIKYDLPEFKEFLSNENPNTLHIGRELKLDNLPNLLPQKGNLFNYKSLVPST